MTATLHPTPRRALTLDDLRRAWALAAKAERRHADRCARLARRVRCLTCLNCEATTNRAADAVIECARAMKAAASRPTRIGLTIGERR